MNSIAERLARLYPDTNRDARIRLVPLRQEIVGKAQPLLLVLLGAVGFVLLIACVNVANLLLARAAVREREIAIRTALGAGRLRLIRQMLTECLLIASLGGALGCLLAIWGVDTLSAVSAGKLPRVQMIGVDSRMFVFTFIATILTALLFGLAPAFQISKAGLHTCLKEGGRSSAMGLRSSRLRGVLVVAEMSLALVLLVGAGLLMRTFLNLEREVPGFDPRNVITMSLDLPGARYPNQKAAALFCRRLIERLKAQPGISEAGVSSDLPWSGYDENSDFVIIGRSDAENSGNHGRYHFVGPRSFQTIRAPLVAGRWFTEGDDAAAQHVTIINH